MASSLPHEHGHQLIRAIKEAVLGLFGAKTFAMRHGHFRGTETELGEQHGKPAARGRVLGKFFGGLLRVSAEKAAVVVYGRRRVATNHPIQREKLCSKPERAGGMILSKE
jgi:hypothetical protein